MNINKMTKAQLIQHISDIEQHNAYISTENDKLTKAVAQLTAAKTYQTPSVKSTDYVNHDKQNTKTAAVREELPPRPATVKQISMILSKFCAYRFARFKLPVELTAKNAMQLINYMDTTTLKTARLKPTKANYSDLDMFYADQNAYYAPQHEWAKALSKRYPSEAGKIQIALHSFKDPVAYEKQVAADEALKAKYDAFYKRTDPSVVAFTEIPIEFKCAYNWAWGLDAFLK